MCSCSSFCIAGGARHWHCSGLSQVGGVAVDGNGELSNEGNTNAGKKGCRELLFHMAVFLNF